MDFSLSKKEILFQQMLREFAEKEVKPLAAEVDEEEKFPIETVEKMAKLGLMGIPFPVEYGGAGGDNMMYSMAVEELSKVCATTGVIVSAHTSLCASPIYEFGTEEQKRKYLPKLCAGEWIGAFGLTEPNAGTDASFLWYDDEGDSYRYEKNICSKVMIKWNEAEQKLVIGKCDGTYPGMPVNVNVTVRLYRPHIAGPIVKKCVYTGVETELNFK